MSTDKEDATARYQNDTMGRTIDDWARHLEDQDPGRRLQALRLLGESIDPKSNAYLERAVDSPDPRISSAAVDYLGRRGAKGASDTLADKLLSPGTTVVLRQHILMALGKIRDPASAGRILDYALSESRAELRATAIHTIGEIGDNSVRDRLKKWNETEVDPALQAQLREALGKLATQRATGSFGNTGSITTFSHSEPNPEASVPSP